MCSVSLTDYANVGDWGEENLLNVVFVLKLPGAWSFPIIFETAFHSSFLKGLKYTMKVRMRWLDDSCPLFNYSIMWLHFLFQLQIIILKTKKMTFLPFSSAVKEEGGQSDLHPKSHKASRTGRSPITRQIFCWLWTPRLPLLYPKKLLGGSIIFHTSNLQPPMFLDRAAIFTS